jgi:hypothetical protein
MGTSGELTSLTVTVVTIKIYENDKTFWGHVAVR